MVKELEDALAKAKQSVDNLLESECLEEVDKAIIRHHTEPLWALENPRQGSEASPYLYALVEIDTLLARYTGSSAGIRDDHFTNRPLWELYPCSKAHDNLLEFGRIQQRFISTSRILTNVKNLLKRETAPLRATAEMLHSEYQKLIQDIMIFEVEPSYVNHIADADGQFKTDLMRIHKTCEHALESLKSDPRGALGGLKKLFGDIGSRHLGEHYQNAPTPHIDTLKQTMIGARMLYNALLVYVDMKPLS